MFTSTPQNSWPLADVAAAVRAAWDRRTCDPVDLADWRPENPSRGQCGVTALVIQDLLGGDLLLAEVHHSNGERQGCHYWNRLPGGAEVDLTREQFTDGEVIGPPAVVTRPPGPPKRRREQYELFRARVLGSLGAQ